MRASGHAASANSPAVTRNPVSMLVAATSAPPSSDPARKPAFSTEVSTAFEAAICRGAPASVGRSAAWAGLCAVVSAVMRAASTRTTANGASTATQAAMPASRSDRPIVLASSTSRRELRSTIMPASGAASPAGTMRASAAIPTAAAPPWL